MEELDDYHTNISGDELDRLEFLRRSLEYFFMDPIKKWTHKGTRPWKLIVQIVKVILFTSQLVVFGRDMATFINYKEELQVSMKQLFLKDWDPSADAIAYPGPYVPYAVYTKQEFINSINYAIRVYSNVTNSGLGQYGYPSNGSDVVPPVKICLVNYQMADFDPSTFKYNFSMQTVTTCKSVEDFAEAGSEKWLQFNFENYLESRLNFTSLVYSTLDLPLRTIIMEDATSGDIEIVCFQLDLQIFYDNRHRVGQILISLKSSPKRMTCQGEIVDSDNDQFESRRILYIFIMLFCLTSTTLCVRSLWRAFRLMKRTEKIMRSHGRILIYSDRIEFIDCWLVIIIVNDLLVGFSTVIMTFYNDRLLETNNYTLCSLLLGIGNFLSWSGLLRYLSFFRQYNLLIITLRKSFLHVTRFMLCTTIIYW